MSERFYYADDVNNINFYMLHAVLLDSEEYSGLTNDARLLYAILYKRLQLSIANGWLDDKGRTYFYYTREDLSKKLRTSEKTCRKAVRQLIDNDLLNEVRQGRGIPNRLYLLKPHAEQKINSSSGDYSGSNPQPQISKTGKNYGSRPGNSTGQDREILPRNKNDKSNNEHNISPLLPPTGEMEVRARIDYRSFSGDDIGIVDKIIDVLLDVQKYRRKTFRIGTYYRDTQEIKNLFKKADRDAVAHAIRAINEAEKIDNFHAYVISVLYNYLSSPAASQKPKKGKNLFTDCQQRDGTQFNDALRELGLS